MLTRGRLVEPVLGSLVGLRITEEAKLRSSQAADLDDMGGEESTPKAYGNRYQGSFLIEPEEILDDEVDRKGSTHSQVSSGPSREGTRLEEDERYGPPEAILHKEGDEEAEKSG